MPYLLISTGFEAGGGAEGDDDDDADDDNDDDVVLLLLALVLLFTSLPDASTSDTVSAGMLAAHMEGRGKGERGKCVNGAGGDRETTSLPSG